MVSRLAIALALCLGVNTAHAESPAEQEARRRYAIAQKLLDEAHWAEALPEFERSYELSRYPALLYKIALCQDQLGQHAAALARYRQYLVEDPGSERRAGVEGRVAALAHEVEAAPALQAATAPSVVAAPAKKPLYKRWWLWTVVGVAAAGVAVGVGVGVALSQRFSPDLGSFGPSLTMRY